MEKMGKVYIVIVTLLVGVLATYIVCDKVFMKKEKTEVVQTQSQDSNVIKGDTKENDVMEVTAEEKYQVFLKQLQLGIASFDDDYYSTTRVSNAMMDIPTYDVSLRKNGELYVNEELIVDHVLSYFVISSGNGGFNTLYFILENGHVGSARVEENMAHLSSEVEMNLDLGYKNIVSIVGGIFGDGISYHDPIFIDIDGNLFHD